MFLKPYEMTEQLYNPINHLTQTELMEKFNLAFYEAQALSKTDITSTFNESFPENSNSTEADKTSDDYLIDYLISNSSDTPASTPNSEVDVNFDFNDFAVDFDQSLSQREDREDLAVESFDTETFTTESSYENFSRCLIEQNSSNSMFSQFFVSPPFSAPKYEEKTCDEEIDFGNIDICEDLTSGSLEDLPAGFDDLECGGCEYVEYEIKSNFLPPVGTITKNNMDFNSFLRSIPADDMSIYNTVTSPKNEFGHLINNTCIKNFTNNIDLQQHDNSMQLFNTNVDNHMVLTQEDALLNDDPLLSSSSVICARRKKQYVPDIYDCDYSDCQEVSSSTNYQCKWETCYQMYDSQINLVKHIEKTHVELKRGEEFTCYWEHCPRKTKPFNARYKLLIHMRVHSGEKPNKCPFKGCNKAFSRLENLKIHQRSHTGERPYLCQFTGCTKSFSNSSDRAKHQRTHFDTKPYACQVLGCTKKYTDPSSLRKHVKNHTGEEQLQIKKKTNETGPHFISHTLVKKFLDTSKQRAVRAENQIHDASFEHSYSSSLFVEKRYDLVNIKKDLKNKLSEKSKLRNYVVKF